jgi:hypothetical protein
MFDAFEATGVRIYDVPFPPSTENLAAYLALQIAGVTEAKNPAARGSVFVRLRETEGIAADGMADIPVRQG